MTNFVVSAILKAEVGLPLIVLAEENLTLAMLLSLCTVLLNQVLEWRLTAQSTTKKKTVLLLKYTGITSLVYICVMMPVGWPYMYDTNGEHHIDIFKFVGLFKVMAVFVIVIAGDRLVGAAADALLVRQAAKEAASKK